MFSKLFVPLMLLAASVLGNETFPDTENLREEVPQVEATGELTVYRDLSAELGENTPRGSSAFLLAAKNRKFLWKPSPDGNRIQPGAALGGAAVSPDESVLVLTEHVGKPSGPNSSRLVLFNLLNGKLMNVFSVPGVKIGELRFVPGTLNLLATELPQNLEGMPPHAARLLLISPKRQKIIAQSGELAAPVLSFVCDGEKIFYTLAGKPDFFELDAGNLSASPVPHRIRLEPSRVALSPDGKTLFHFGPGHLRRYSMEDGRAILQDSEVLEERFSPEKLLFADDGGTRILMFGNGKVVLRAQKISRVIHEKAYGIGCTRPAEGEGFFAIPYQESIVYLKADGTPSMTVSPGRLKPFSRNRIARIFALSGKTPELILIDHAAHIFRLKIRPRRWEKTEIYSPRGI